MQKYLVLRDTKFGAVGYMEAHLFVDVTNDLRRLFSKSASLEIEISILPTLLISSIDFDL